MVEEQEERGNLQNEMQRGRGQMTQEIAENCTFGVRQTESRHRLSNDARGAERAWTVAGRLAPGVSHRVVDRSVYFGLCFEWEASVVTELAEVVRLGDRGCDSGGRREFGRSLVDASSAKPLGNFRNEPGRTALVVPTRGISVISSRTRESRVITTRGSQYRMLLRHALTRMQNSCCGDSPGSDFPSTRCKSLARKAVTL